jgi:hypothetical protein
MKITAILSAILLATVAGAHSFVVEGTNIIHIQFQDSALNDAQKELIGADVVRTVTPGLPYVQLRALDSQPSNESYLQNLGIPENAFPGVYIPRAINVAGTNFTLKIDKEYSDAYLARSAFWNTHSNAIAQAFVFADLLITNPISGMQDSQINWLRLTKEYAPQQIPTEILQDIRIDLGQGVFFPPSLLGFQMLPYGPVGSEQYLWGILPNRDSHEVDSIPIIYYQNRWWISYWGMETGEQEW